MKAEQLTDVCTHHGEGPYWDSRIGSLLCVDMLEGDVLVHARDGKLTRHSVDPAVAAVVRGRDSGGYVVGVEKGFVFADSSFSRIDTGPVAFTDPSVRMNDGGCDPRGRFLCGSMGWEGQFGAGTLYSLAPDHSVSTVLSSVSTSNGLHWNAAGDTAFYSDTPTQRIDALDYDLETGTFSGRRTFALVDPALGAPDGMAIDSDGGIWTALYGGSAVVRYDADGRLSERIDVPASQVTACAFGGEDLRTLFITTSRQGLADGEEPLAGALFSVAAGVTGAPLPLFAG
ncbi:SMP-30/gluconolactonase/LRE family protein [Arthrobacter sp. Br18]|uniref:SMP-30/gluconolactonase/LRE family protein n=1 Tax=Arthrobacter sp. Br18 TaxID=1312954 RepID=UPI00047BE02A|nr:SMP-30/gluconolactonase/LRE family protein [Arthrobacter sp. Br18]